MQNILNVMHLNENKKKLGKNQVGKNQLFQNPVVVHESAAKHMILD
jgi:hypothetical protein